MKRDLVEYRRWRVQIIGYAWVGTDEDDQEKEIFYDECEYFPTHEKALEKAKEFNDLAEDEDFANYTVECEEECDVVSKLDYENYYTEYEIID